MRIATSSPPGSAIGNAGYRALMLAGSSRLARRRDRSSIALARALRGTALGRIPAAERAWTDRIDAYRQRLPLDAIAAVPDALDRADADRLAEAREALQWMSIPPLLGHLVTRLVAELSPRSCLELGTGFGLSTAYQAAALELNGAGTLTTLDIEGMTALARPGLSRLALAHRVELIGGRIEDTLEGAVERAAPVDYALLDADHTERGTLTAFDTVLPGLAGGAVVVVDDINWTEEMRRAWRAIKAHERVGTAVSLRRLGIVIVTENRA